MKLRDRLKEIFRKTDNTEEFFEKEIEYEIIIAEKNIFAYHLKENGKYVLIKDNSYSFNIYEEDVSWLELNKDNFDYYEEFLTLKQLYNGVVDIQKREKTEDEYLEDYLKNCTKDYEKIIRRMKTFKIDSEQYNNLIEKIKTEIKWELNNTLNNFTDMNEDLTTTRTYDELMENLQELRDFEKKYPYYKSAKFDDRVSHCGYPNYMWQAGVEGTYVVLRKIPFSRNSLFIHNEYIGGDSNEEYITKMMIVSEKERENVLDYWDKIQDENELQFENKCISASIREDIENNMENEEEM